MHRFMTLITTLFLLTTISSAWTPIKRTVITTERGERIVCTIVKETGNYFVIDDRGYQRHVLKRDIKSVERGVIINPEPLPRRKFVQASGGIGLTGQDISPLHGSLQASAAIGITDMLSMGLGVDHSRAWSRNPKYYNDKLFRGPINMTGVHLMAIWDYAEWKVRPMFSVGVGAYLLSHTVPSSTIAQANTPVEDFLVVPGVNELTGISTKIDPGFGAQMSAGAMYPLTNRLWLTGSLHGMMVRSEFERTKSYTTIDPATAQHALILYDIQALVGLRFDLQP
jgi:hypothetical protein